jgi:hypothetical protein
MPALRPGRLVLAVALTTLPVITLLSILSVDAAADTPIGGGTYTITAAHSGKCLQPTPGSESAQGAALVQMPCDGSAAQRHTLVAADADQFQIKTGSGHCCPSKGDVSTTTPRSSSRRAPRPE